MPDIIQGNSALFPNPDFFPGVEPGSPLGSSNITGYGYADPVLAYRSELWELSRYIGLHCPGHALVNGNLRPFRTGRCGIRPITKAAGVPLREKPGGYCYFCNVQLCGSVWACPGCSFVIRRRRGEDLRQIVNAWRDQGEVLLCTFTFPHSVKDSLINLWPRLAFAYSGVTKRGRISQALRKDFGFVGTITSKEAPWGKASGWHPHIHALMFVRARVDLDHFKARLMPLWIDGCKKAGLRRPSWDRGLDVQLGNAAGEYVSKQGWDLGSEMVAGHMKSGKLGGVHAFELVRMHRRGELPQGMDLYFEFFKATYGTRATSNYRSLGRLLGVEYLSDSAIADEIKIEDLLCGELGLDSWRRVCKHGTRKAEIIRVWKKTRDFNEVKSFIERSYQC